SNVDYVYDGDPNINVDAKPIKNITWTDFEKLVPTEWSPGINVPFDPVAARLAKKHEITVVIANGEKFDNLNKIIEGDSSFTGTTITPSV
ncbi:MAG: UMP kinase, partial [Microgenomates group bacterium]